MILDRIKQSVLNIIHDLSDPNYSADDTDGVKTRIERLHGMVVSLEASFDSSLNLNLLTKALSDVVTIMGVSTFQDDLNPLVNLVNTNGKGAPKFQIPKSLLQFYLRQGFTTPQISDMIRVSESTVKRRLKVYDLKRDRMYSALTDDELDEKVNMVLADFPNTGYKRMKGFLLSDGLKVQEERVREAMRRVDPEGVMLRGLQSHPVIRRKYKVAGPLSLYHMDGNHKLIA